MVIAAYLSTALVVAGVGAFHLLGDRNSAAVLTMTTWSLATVALLAPLQVLVGHESGSIVLKHQPAKLAAMEGHWETHRGYAPMILFAWPDQKNETNHFEISVPKIGSLIVTNSWSGTIRGLKEWPASDRPPVAVVFFAFRIMVGLGFAMLALGLWAAFTLWKGRLVGSAWLLRYALVLAPSGFLAILAGWYTAEVGRQPFTVYGLLRTSESVSPISARSVGLSLTVFVMVYAIVFAAGISYLLALMRKAPDETPLQAPKPPQPGVLRGTPLAAVESDEFQSPAHANDSRRQP
jgi:cytochrome d ubiquinol oxidase subunit I